MRILQISPQIPLPLDNGGRMGIYGITKHLSLKGHKITFAAYLKQNDFNSSYTELSRICDPVILNVQTENDYFKALLNLLSDVPYNISKFITPELKDFLHGFFRHTQVDIVHVDHLHMAWCIDLLRELTDAPVVLREHNLEYRIMQRYSEKATNPILRKYASLQFRKLKEYEIKLTSRFDMCTMVSEEDENLLRKINPSVKAVTIPAGVDSNLLDMEVCKTVPYTIAHVGDMSWLPNHDGLNWYLNEIFPIIVQAVPQVKLFLYGKGNEKLNIPDNIRNNVAAVGYVENIWNEIADKQLCIVPLRVGSGIRIKILEMMAAGKNILSTSVGKEGINVEDGKEILIADSPGDFADKTLSFFRNEYDRVLMSDSARSFVRQYYTWEVVSGRFEKTYLQLIK